MKKLILDCNTLIHKIMLRIAQLSLLFMVILVTYTVTLRYVFNSGFGWAEEVPVLLVTLFAFLAMAMGVRDRLHIGVSLVYNLFPKNGAVRRFLLFFGDLVVLLCGLFMLYYGCVYCARLYNLPGRLPMTGLATWWQYLPVPIAGFVISFDSVLFLAGMIGRDDFLYSAPDTDFEEEYKEQRREQKKDARPGRPERG